jgi:short-subunit dehydrogenase
MNNKYALITGSSQGLGKALAIECAKRQIDLILVALPGSGIKNVGLLIEQEFGVKAICFETDLCVEENCIELYNNIKIRGASIYILINNAGILGTTLFEKSDTKYLQRLISINILAPIILTRLFLADLKQNRHSYVLNVGSLASFFYLPLKQVYGASKSFVFSFSKSLRKELSPYGVKISVLCPGGINTNDAVIKCNKAGSFISKRSIMEPEDVAAIAITKMFAGKAVIIPGKLNRFFVLLNKWMPVYIKDKIIQFHMHRLLLERKRAEILVPARA